MERNQKLNADAEKEVPPHSFSRNRVRIERRISEALSVEKVPVTEALILRKVMGRRSDKIAALRSLVERSVVHRLGSGVKGDPYVYRLSQANFPASTTDQGVFL